MSKFHNEILAHLANMEQSITRIHARTPILIPTQDPNVKNSVKFIGIDQALKDARADIVRSSLSSNSGEHLAAMTQLREGMNKHMGIVDGLKRGLNGQVSLLSSGNSKFTPEQLQDNLADASAAMEHLNSAMDSYKNYAVHIKENMSEIEETAKQKQREMIDNARDVVDSVADENNLLLPGNYVNRPNKRAPNGE